MPETIVIGKKKYTVTFVEDYAKGYLIGKRQSYGATVTICVIRRGNAIYSGVAIKDYIDEKNPLVGQAVAFKRACAATLRGEHVERARESMKKAGIIIPSGISRRVNEAWSAIRKGRRAEAERLKAETLQPECAEVEA